MTGAKTIIGGDGCGFRTRFTRLMRVIGLVVTVTAALIVCADEQVQSQPAGPVVDSAASADGVMIYYEVVGEGNPALVFVHGWSCDRGYWAHEVKRFSPHYKVVTVDLAGHGQSGRNRENYSMVMFGADVAAVVNKLELDSVILIGHSMGGPVIVEAARGLSGKVIGLVGADTFQDLDAVVPQAKIDELLNALKADFASTTYEFVRSMFSAKADSIAVRTIAEDMASAPPEVAINSIANLLYYGYGEALQEVRVPIRCINSAGRPVDTVSGRKYAASFAVKFIPDVGHFVMIEKPMAFDSLLDVTVNELVHSPVEK